MSERVTNEEAKLVLSCISLNCEYCDKLNCDGAPHIRMFAADLLDARTQRDAALKQLREIRRAISVNKPTVSESMFIEAIRSADDTGNGEFKISDQKATEILAKYRASILNEGIKIGMIRGLGLAKIEAETIEQQHNKLINALEKASIHMSQMERMLEKDTEFQEDLENIRETLESVRRNHE